MQFKQRHWLVIAIIVATVVIGGGLWVALRPTSPAAIAASPTPPIPTDLAPNAITDPAFPSLTYAIHTFLWWNESTRTIDLDNVRLIRFSHVKQIFAWDDMEPERGRWDWERADAVINEVENRGLKLVARLDSPPNWAMQPTNDPTQPPIDLAAWGEFCGTLADRYQGRIAAYQVWNEPNLQREWFSLPPNPQGYVTLLRACSEAIRAADPNAIIISAGLAPTGTWLPAAIPDVDYLRMLYDAGFAPYFDVLGVHAPGYGNRPEMSPDEAAAEDGHRWMCFRHVEDMRAIMVEEGDAAKQIALLEVGWTTDTIHPDYSWQAVTPEQQSEYLVGAYQWAADHWRPWVGLMVTIFMADPTWTEDDEQYWWSINEAGYQGYEPDPWLGRPAYYGLSWMARYTGDTYIPAVENPGDPDIAIVEPLPPAETATP
jgi:hypothetical protein